VKKLPLCHGSSLLWQKVLKSDPTTANTLLRVEMPAGGRQTNTEGYPSVNLKLDLIY
jgi:hypothetical protein